MVQYIANSDHKTVDEVLRPAQQKERPDGRERPFQRHARHRCRVPTAGNENAIIARDMLVWGIRKYIGAYAAAMNGVDAIVFTAGIGENNQQPARDGHAGFRVTWARSWTWRKNQDPRRGRDFSTDDSTVKVCVIPTDEEFVIAKRYRGHRDRPAHHGLTGQGLTAQR